MEQLKNLDKLPEKATKTIEPYLKKMLVLHGENIRSIAVYGSAAGRDFNPRTSDINSLVLFERLDFSDLKKSLPLISDGIRRKITAPLFLTRQHLETSCDTFPVEFLEMKENNVLVYGDDVLSGLRIDPAHIRLQCEYHLKGKLVRLRQAYLEIGLRAKGLEALLKESFAALMPIFRNLLRLKGKTPPVAKEEVIAGLGEEFGIDKELFLAILRDKKDDEKIGSKEIEPCFRQYVDEIDMLAQAADTLL